MTSNNATPDYSQLIDKQTWTFIQRTQNAYPDNATELDIDQQRALYDAMCRAFHPGTSSGVCSVDNAIRRADQEHIYIRQYTPSTVKTKKPVSLIYLHGGGFVVGSLESHDDVCAEMCARTGLCVTSVDYRLSPEHKHPAALDDAMQAIQHIYQCEQKPIVLCGDSAGANLAAAACHAYRNQRSSNQPVPDIIGQLLIYPGLGGDTTTGSYITHAHAPMLSTREVVYYTTVRCQHTEQSSDPLFAPLHDNSFKHLPPTVVFSAECDPLRDDGDAYCSKIRLAGGKAHCVNESGLVHGYLRARHSVARASRSFDRIVEALVRLADKQWPY